MSCKLCLNNDVFKKHVIKGIDIYKCRYCGFEFADYNKDVSKIYNESYFQGDSTDKYKSSTIFEPLSQEKIHFINKYVKRDSRVLEIGPSEDGGFLKYLISYLTIPPTAVEISEYASDILTDFGIDTFNGTIEDYTRNTKFDVIIATEVIEHLENQLGAVTAIYDLLNDGGLFIMATGNTSSLEAILNGTRWYYYDPPFHLSYFNHSNIELLLLEFKKV